MARECERCEHLSECKAGQDRYTICCSDYMPKKPLTNGDFLRICSTDCLAEFLWQYTHDLITDWEHINDPMFRQMPLKNILGDNCTKKEAWVEWLKKPHND